jgi:signal transduction histidine kinase
MLLREGGEVEYCNPAAAAILGDDAEGCGLGMTTDGESPLAEKLKAGFRRLRGRGGSELVISDEQDGPRYYWMTLSAPRNASARLLMMQDVGAALGGSDELGKIVSQLTHDLRNPLTSIAGAAEMMRSQRLGELPPSVMRLAGIVQEGARRIDEILTRLKGRFPRTTQMEREGADG